MQYYSYLELCFITIYKYCLNSYRCFGGEVLEGYGMTETSCVISTMDIGDKLIGHVGSPNPSCGKALCLDFQGYNNIKLTFMLTENSMNSTSILTVHTP